MRLAILSYLLWGFFPIFWRLLSGISFTILIFHRVIWTWFFYSIFKSVKQRQVDFGFQVFLKQTSEEKLKLFYCSILLFSNWLVYVIAVVTGRVVESSLGYFLNPLVSICLGAFFLKEKLNRFQWTAICFAVIGVVLIGISVGQPPWFALFLAMSFGLYGFVKKKSKLEAIVNSQLETLLMIPYAFIFFFCYSFLNLDLVTLHFENISWFVDSRVTHFFTDRLWLHIVGGVVTGFPLICFAEALLLLRLSTVGFLQYISPTIQFLTGVFIVKESVPQLKIAGFVVIWLGLFILVSRNIFWQMSRRNRGRHSPGRMP